MTKTDNNRNPEEGNNNNGDDDDYNGENDGHYADYYHQIMAMRMAILCQ